MTYQELLKLGLEAAPAFGTFILGLIVYRSARAQDEFGRAVSAHNAAFAEQQLRVDLLDRRVAAITALREISVQMFGILPLPDQDRLSARAMAAVQTAELLYDGETRARLSDFLSRFFEAQMVPLNSIGRDLNSDELQKRLTKSVEAHDALRSIISSMVSASAAEPLPKLPHAAMR